MDLSRFTLISDLKEEEIRCKIKNTNKEGEQTFITVYNILGEKRVQVMKDLENIVGDGEEINAQKFNEFYLGLIIEFTDLIMDRDDILFLLNEGNLTSKILMQEMNDMVYELQYEKAMENLANIRTMTINMIAQEGLAEMKYLDERLRKQAERGRKLIKQKEVKRNRVHKPIKAKRK